MKKISIVLLLIMVFIGFIAFNKINSNFKRVLITGKIVGISLKNDDMNQENIGVMTYLDDSTNSFVLLSHGLYNNGRLDNIDIADCYEINEINIDKSSQTKIGSLNAKFDIDNQIGKLSENTNKGVYGIANDSNQFSQKNVYYEIASKFDVEKGKAEIYLDLFDEGIEAYEIEIEKIDYFNYTHNIYVKIVDEELLELTGGVVRGLSGAPIIQNGKLVGAINYGTESDVTRGCAIFADKL